jgi:hypothetical protein
MAGNLGPWGRAVVLAITPLLRCCQMSGRIGYLENQARRDSKAEWPGIFPLLVARSRSGRTEFRVSQICKHEHRPGGLVTLVVPSPTLFLVRSSATASPMLWAVAI